MDRSDSPSEGALKAVLRLAGPSATLGAATRLKGGQHATTWRIETAEPALRVVVREFPPGDAGAAGEQVALRTLDGLGGLAPVLLGGDLEGRWSDRPTSLISCLDGSAEITPADPVRWAQELGRALAVVHAFPGARLGALPSVFDRPGGSEDALRGHGPLAATVRSRWAEIVSSAEVLTHSDYWSGNVVFRGQRLVGVVDWTGAARGPRGYDLGWCRLDLILLYDERIADIFGEAYEKAAGRPVRDMLLWDIWAAARAHEVVDEWEPNYAPLGRPDLDARSLRDRHTRWTEHLLEAGAAPA